MSLTYYKGKKVLVTGHTGFKGSWLCHILNLLGSDVYGYSLKPPTEPNLYSLINEKKFVTSKKGDVADYRTLSEFYSDVHPDAVFHLAAQPTVREGYRNPRGTYLSNVMGTVNILECVREYGAASFINVTTDKVYDNLEKDDYMYSENDRLDGFDPYSNSKSCSDLVTHSYVRSFPKDVCPISTARAGNVIGGGDFAPDRIIPDCIRAVTGGRKIVLRNPNSIRPYQHVLEPLYSYLSIVALQASDRRYSGSYNIGPDMDDYVTTGELATLFCKSWGNGAEWITLNDNGPHEVNFLKLNNSLIKSKLHISPLWHINTAIEKTVQWTKVWNEGGDVLKCVDSQINEYLKGRETTI